MPEKQNTQRIRYWAFPVCLMITVSIFSANPAPQFTGPTFEFKDKIAHLAVFGLLATGFYRAAILEFRITIATLIAIGATSLFGLMDEIHQGLNPNRYMELYDWLADALGAIIAVYVYRSWKTYQQCLEIKPIRVIFKKE